MNERRVGFAALIAIAAVFFFFRPSPPAVQPSVPPNPAIASQAAGSGSASAPSAGTNQAAAPAAPGKLFPTLDELTQAASTTVTNQDLTITITHLGARLTHATVNAYRESLAPNSPAYDHVAVSDGSPLPLAVYIAGSSDSLVTYQLSSVSDVSATTLSTNGTLSANGTLGTNSQKSFLVGEQPLILTFTGSLPNGIGITKAVTVPPHGHVFDVAFSFTGISDPTARAEVEWSRFVPLEKQHDRYNLEQLAVFNTQGKVVREDPATHYGNSIDDTAQWIATGNKYFAAFMWTPEKPAVSRRGARVALNPDGSQRGGLFFTRLNLSTTGGEVKLYVGPVEHDSLLLAGANLEKDVDLGFFSFLAYPLLIFLKLIHAHIISNWGVSIIILTLSVKLLFFPLTKASFASMRKMQEIGPEIAALKERIKDPTLLNQETFALYKRKGINPFGGCLPILLQIPVFFGLYSALFNAFELRHAPYALWVKDLSVPESLMMFGIPVPPMLILLGISMSVQQRLMPQSATMDPAQKKIMNFMPIMFAGMMIISRTPAGLDLYMLTNNLISIVQQACMKNDSKLSPFKAMLLGSFAIAGIGMLFTVL